MFENNVTQQKAYVFAIRIVKSYKYLSSRGEYVLSKQLLRSGTAIGALIREGVHADSVELVKLLTSTVKTLKDSLGR